MTAVRSSLVPHAVLLIPLRAKKCILVAQQHKQKQSVKADLAIYMWSSTFSFWVVHEYNFQKVDFSLCAEMVDFFKDVTYFNVMIYHIFIFFVVKRYDNYFNEDLLHANITAVTLQVT